jgi:hypothetical protein
MKQMSPSSHLRDPMSIYVFLDFRVLTSGRPKPCLTVRPPKKEIHTLYPRLSCHLSASHRTQTTPRPLITNHAAAHPKQASRYRQPPETTWLARIATHPSNLGSQILATQSRNGPASSLPHTKLVIGVQPVRSHPSTHDFCSA